MRQVLMFGFAVLATFGPVSGSRAVAAQPSAAEAQAAGEFEGFWRNTLSDAGFVRYLDIRAVDGNRVEIQGWLRCLRYGQSSDRLSDCEHWGPDDAYVSSAGTLKWRHLSVYNYSEEQDWESFLTLSNGVLEMQSTRTDVASSMPPLVNRYDRIARPPSLPGTTRPPSSGCSIVGRATGPRADAAPALFSVILYGPDNPRASWGSTRFVGDRYRFLMLPPGRYRLVIDRRADVDIKVTPSDRTVDCRSGGVTRADFDLR